MADPILARGSFDGGEIRADAPFSEIAAKVMAGNVFILKGVFSGQVQHLLKLRLQIFEWGQTVEAAPEPSATDNNHCLQAGVSRFQRTPHIYHSFNFNRISALPASLAGPLKTYFQALTKFQNAITRNDALLEDFSGGAALHPQIIQYPAGGGFFGRHYHPLEPQRIGLIVGLSRRGSDYDQGGVSFEVDAGFVHLESHHDFGDIAIFRFDLPHWVAPSSLSEKFDWSSERGRWSMVLPYY